MNFSDDQWAVLSNLLAPIRLSHSDDQWVWRIDSNGLLLDMDTRLFYLPSSLAKNSWSDTYPKQIKFFIWELAHSAINTQDTLQPCLQYISISPNWCILCKNSAESQQQIFHTCTFVSKFWNEILRSFGWKTALPLDIKDLIPFLFSCHPSKKGKELLWLHIINAFFGTRGWNKIIEFSTTRRHLLIDSLILSFSMLLLGVNLRLSFFRIAFILF